MANPLAKYTGTCKRKVALCILPTLMPGTSVPTVSSVVVWEIAVGAALTQQMHKAGRIVVCFLVMAQPTRCLSRSSQCEAIWNLRSFPSCINNGYGICWHQENDQCRASISVVLLTAFLEQCGTVASVMSMRRIPKKLLKTCRSGKGPVLISESVTYRWLEPLHLTLKNTGPVKSRRVEKDQLKTFASISLKMKYECRRIGSDSERSERSSWSFSEICPEESPSREISFRRYFTRQGN